MKQLKYNKSKIQFQGYEGNGAKRGFLSLTLAKKNQLPKIFANCHDGP